MMHEGLLRNVSGRALTHAPVPQMKPIAELDMGIFMLIGQDV